MASQGLQVHGRSRTTGIGLNLDQRFQGQSPITNYHSKVVIWIVPTSFLIEGWFWYDKCWYFKGLLSAQLQGNVVPTPLPRGNHDCKPALAMAKVSRNTQKCQSLGVINVQCPALYLHLQEEQRNSFHNFSCFRCLQTSYLGHQLSPIPL